MQHPREIHNWGVFGADDEIGTLNYLTPDAVLRGVATATRGQVHQLSLPLNLGPVVVTDAPNCRR